MKNRKFGVAIAALAAGALTLGACSGGGNTTGTSPAGTDPVTTEPADPGTGTETGSDDGTTRISVMWNQPFYSYNSDTSRGNATANNNILYMIRSGFFYYGEGLELVHDTDFGTFEKISDEPLTVKYTVNEGVKWSDGVQVGAADMLLSWASGSGKFNNVEAEYDEETGDIINQEELDAGVWFDTSSPAMALVTETPEIGDDGRSLTLKYDKPRSDWEVAFGIGVPAHVVANHALGTSGAEGAQAAIDAIVNEDVEALSKMSKFWNTGFNFESLPDDPSLYLSNGPMMISEYVEGQYMTLVKNPDFTWGTPAAVDEIVVRYSEDPLAGVNALQNGEVNIIQPQATVDTISALEAIPGVKIEQGPTATYEHVDVVFNNGGPFDPATYGGDEAKALAVRQAFLTCIPRQEILDKLIKPLDPGATIRESYVYVPGSPGYDEVVAANGMNAAFGTGDPAKSLQILQDAGIDTATPIAVRFLYAGTNERRIQEYQLIAASCNQAGFNVVDEGDTGWGARLAEASTYDASLFGWQSTNTYALNAQANFITDGQNNFGGMSNARVDEIWDELETNTDPAAEYKLLGEMEAELVKEAFGVTLFQHPGVTAYTDTVSNVSALALAPTMFWNFWEWTIDAQDVIE